MPEIVETHAFMGIFFGAFGGMIAAIMAIFENFKSLPKKAMSRSRTAQNTRMMFVTYRVIVGAMCGFLVSFWFSSDVVSGHLELEQLVFIQGVSGMASSFIPKLPIGLNGSS